MMIKHCNEIANWQRAMPNFVRGCASLALSVCVCACLCVCVRHFDFSRIAVPKGVCVRVCVSA